MKAFSDYQTKQFERGVAWAKDHQQDKLQPDDADADSVAFQRGYIQKKHDINFGPRGDEFEGDVENALRVLNLGNEYYWDLRMLDQELFLAILNLMEKLADGEEAATEGS